MPARQSIALAALLALGLAAGCAKQDYEAAVAANTSEAFEEFLKNHPDTEFSEAARKKISDLREKKDLERLESAESSKAYQVFLEAHPDTEKRAEVEKKIEDLVFQEAVYHYERTQDVAAHTARVYDVLFTEDGQYLISAGGDLDLKVRNAVTTATVNTIALPNTTPVRALAGDSTGKYLLGGSDRIIKWNLSNGEVEGTIKSNMREILAIAIHPGGQLAVSGNTANSGNVDVWDIRDYYLMESLQGHTLEVNSVVFSPDGKTFYTGSSDRTILVWNTESLQSTGKYSLDDKINAMAVSPDGKRLYFGGRGNNTLGYIELESGKKHEIARMKGSVNDLSISKGGKYLVSVSEDRRIVIWDTATERTLDEFFSSGPAVAVDFAPADRAIVVAEESLRISVFTKSSEQYLTGFARKYFDSGQLDRARSFLLRAANAKMLGAEGYFLLGKIFTIQEDGEQAVRSLLWADKLQPEDPQIINEMARAFDRRKKPGDDAKAIAAYKRVYKLMGRSREGAKAYEVLVDRLGPNWEEEEKKRR